MISVIEKTLCCGCGACSQSCPKKCINMIRDAEGFLYPIVNEALCTGCGECNKVCPIETFNNNVEQDINAGGGYPYVYGGWHKDRQIRYDSSSGGAFTLFSEWILKHNGIVYGCMLNEEMKAVHVSVDSVEELWKLRGSKYVQSEIGNVYSEIKRLLEDERWVMFVGTPCQAAGLMSYLKWKKYEKLYIIDFICHGVPSPGVFNEYINYLTEKENSKVVHFRFRNKDYGWNGHGLQLGTEILYENGKRERIYPAFKDPFMNGFSTDIYLRPSCYACHFKKLPKNYADITIADFWGVTKVVPKLYDKKGTSVVIIHGEHGNELWHKVKNKFEHCPVELAKIIKYNQCLVKSVQMNPNRDKFFEVWKNESFIEAKKRHISTFKWIFDKIVKIVNR